MVRGIGASATRVAYGASRPSPPTHAGRERRSVALSCVTPRGDTMALRASRGVVMVTRANSQGTNRHTVACDFNLSRDGIRPPCAAACGHSTDDGYRRGYTSARRTHVDELCAISSGGFFVVR